MLELKELSVKSVFGGFQNVGYNLFCGDFHWIHVVGSDNISDGLQSFVVTSSFSSRFLQSQTVCR